MLRRLGVRAGRSQRGALRGSFVRGHGRLRAWDGSGDDCAARRAGAVRGPGLAPGQQRRRSRPGRRPIVRPIGVGAALRARHRGPCRVVRVRHPRLRRVLQPHDTARNVVGNEGGQRLAGTPRLRPADRRARHRGRQVGAEGLLVVGDSHRRPAAHDLDPAEPRRRRGTLLALPDRLAARRGGYGLDGRLALSLVGLLLRAAGRPAR